MRDAVSRFDLGAPTGAPTHGGVRPGLGGPGKARLPGLSASLLGAAALLASYVSPAHADLAAVGPVDAATGFPAWLQDGAGLRLEPCLDEALCFPGTSLPDPTQPPSVPGNVPEETFYWVAEAITPTSTGGTAFYRAATEAAFLPDIAPGNQVLFNRIRFRVTGLVPGATYTFTHPYGVHTFEATDPRRSTLTVDIGCFAACTDFAEILDPRSPVGPWLMWDPAVGPAAPAGFVGDFAVPHSVTGSPFGTNFFEVQDASGAVIAHTDLFNVAGRISGPGVRIDETAPVITFGAPSGTRGGDGWFRSDVVIPFVASDADSGVAFTEPAASPLVLSTEGPAVSAMVRATDVAGNSATLASPAVKIDKTPPRTTASLAGPAGSNGWYRGPVTLTLAAADALSGVASTQLSLDGGATWQPYSAASGQLTRDGAFTIQYRSVDVAGNVEATQAVSVKIDQTPPGLTGSRAPAAGATSWNNGPVTVSFVCADAGSGVAACPGPATLAGEGASQSVTGTATDAAGNTASATVGGINIDLTPPTVTYTGNQGTYTVDQTVSITCAAADALSGVAATTCTGVSGPAYAYALGSHSYTAEATDKAGNVGRGATSFTVQVTYETLCTLTKQFVAPTDIADSLCAKLTAAAAAAAGEKASAKAGALGAYANELAAQSGKALSADQADILGRLAGTL